MNRITMVVAAASNTEKVTNSSVLRQDIRRRILHHPAPLRPLKAAGGNRMSHQSFFIFQAETIEAMRRAFEEVCGNLQLRKGEPSSALAAERIFQLAKEGERDPALLASRVIALFPRQ
jgi:hypothetical protein